MWRRVGRHSVVFTGSAVVMAVLQVAFRMVAVSGLTVSDYGRVALLLSVFNVALVVGHFSVPIAAVRLAALSGPRARDPLLLRRLASSATLPAVVASLIVAAAGLAFTHDPSAAMLAALGMPPMVGAVIGAGYLRGKGLVGASALVQPANALAQLAVLAGVYLVRDRIDLVTVVAAFTVGNFAATALAVFFMVRWSRRASSTSAPTVSSAREIVHFSAWLTTANIGIYVFTVAPRLDLLVGSYREVAFFDLALLLYTLPSRLTASFVTALIPVATDVRSRGERVVVPSRLDLVVLGLVTAAIDLVLWLAGVPHRVLEIFGLRAYDSSAGLLLILLLGVPGELFFALHSALFQAFAMPRRLALVVWATALPFLLLGPLAASVSPSILAVLLVAAYWALGLVARLLSPPDAFEVVHLSQRLLWWHRRPGSVTT
jgi:O-antigen/teichoic acid export membrane protein